MASLVVFEDGLPRKSDYRRFNISQDATDDTAAVREVVTRRFRKHLEHQLAHPEVAPDAEAPRRFAYPPSLLVVDGGAPQVAAAAAALAELGIDDISICGLAKRLEEVWLPDDPDPVILDRQSQGLYLLQRLRDEAHRFAITGHRAKRSRAMTVSLLDDVPGLGEVRKKALLRRFGSLRRLRQATVAEVASVPGIGPRTAEQVVAVLAASPAPSSVNVTTGEIREDTP